MAPKWSDARNFKFIVLYKRMRCLWDQNHEKYKDKKTRDAALIQIANEMNIKDFGIVETKAKIKSLRGTFNIECTKIKKSEELGEEYVPTLRWFEDMKEVMMNESATTSTTSTMTPSKTCTKREDEPEVMEYVINNTTDESTYGEDYDLVGTWQMEHDYPSVNQSKRHHSPDVQPAPKRFNNSSTGQQIEHREPYVNTQLDEHEHDIFGKHVATQLKMLSPLQAVVAVGKISQILTECRLADLKSCTNATGDVGVDSDT